VWGTSEWLAALGHGGREVVPADICMRIVGTEVRWWCSPSPLLDDCVGSVSPRWRGRVACAGCSQQSVGGGMDGPCAAAEDVR
jgi:predicted transcriptional regulator